METKLLEIILAFVSGVFLSLIGQFIATIFQKRQKSKERRESASFKIYMLLLEMHSHYFWIFTAEIHNEEPSLAVREDLRKLSWKVADILRQNDDIQHLENILIFLFSEEFNTVHDRYSYLDELLKTLGKTVNPNYSIIIKRITKKNQDKMLDMPRPKSSVPGSSS